MATAERTSLVDLAGLGAADLPTVGGKAANLGVLIAGGFRVPDGFCVRTDAYTAAAAAAGLPALLAAPGHGGPGDLADLAGRARAALLAVEMPAGLAADVRRAYLGLGADVPVAVRSSATTEDLPTTSAAGQQDTFLHVVGAEAVLDAVRRCWASLWTDRAVAYRAAAGIDHGAVLLAVVVQRMVDAQVAGILFTADPVSGRRTRTVIDASPGLGEAVVSGAVNPDHVVVEGDGTVVEHRVGDKRVEVRPRPGGGTEHVAGSGTAPCLTGARIAELAALGRRVQAHLGAPQDVEWAIDSAGEVWLTQTRPITTLFPLPPARGDGLRVYLCASLAQGLVRPITPMGLSAFRVVTAVPARTIFDIPVADPDGPPAFVEAGGRAFADITGVVRSRVGRQLAPRILDVMEARSAVALRALFDEPALAVRTRSRLPFLRRVLRVFARYRVPSLVLLALVRPAAARRRVARIGAELRALAEPGGRGCIEPAPAQRLDHVHRLLAACFPIMPRVAPVAAAGFAALAVAHRLAGGELGHTWTSDVLRSLPHNPTTAMDLELWALAVRLRADAESAAVLRDTAAGELAGRYRAGALPPVLQYGLRDFLARHGHRAVAEIDLGMPRWSDDPGHVLGVLANYLRQDDPALAPDAQFARGARAADAAIDRAVARVRRRSRSRAVALRFALGRVRALAGMRETHKDYLVGMLAAARGQLAAVGAELARRGLLDDADDVFFLDLVQARTALAGADHRAQVRRRRADYARELRRRHVPRVLLSDGTEPEALVAPAAAGPGALGGTPASAGVVTAPARVVLDPVGAHLEPGEILVAPSTDPGWTPLFLTAGGLVMEMGGANSHGAVVAREYGIPAVVGVADATTRLRTGQPVTVDGAAGTVRPVSP